jgi:hypothetical protein
VSSPLGGVSAWCLPTISTRVRLTIGDVLPDRVMIGASPHCSSPVNGFVIFPELASPSGLFGRTRSEGRTASSCGIAVSAPVVTPSHTYPRLTDVQVVLCRSSFVDSVISRCADAHLTGVDRALVGGEWGPNRRADWVVRAVSRQPKVKRISFK